MNVTGGTLKVTNNEFKVENEEGTNDFRIQPGSRVTSNAEFLAKGTLRLGGGKGTQIIAVQSGAEGGLCYEAGNEYDSNKRLTWQHDVTAHRELKANAGLTVSGDVVFNKNTEVGHHWALYGEIDGDENGRMLYAHTNNPGESDAVNYMGRMTLDSNLVNKGYVDKAMEGAAGGGDAYLDANQEWTGANHYKNPTYFESSIISSSNTVMEFRGDPNNPEDRHFKIRRGINMTIYCYAGQDNGTPKKCFHAKWDKDQSNPEVFINYLADPTANGHPTTLRYCDANYVSKAGDTISSYLKVESASSGTSSKPFAVYTKDEFDKPRFHVSGTGSVCAGTTSSDAFMANYDYDIVTLKKLKEEIEDLRNQCTPLLWRYNPDVQANSLGDGEFNLGATPDWDGDGSTYLYISKLNIKGKKWYGVNGGSAYSHDMDWWGIVTICDYDPDIVLQAKAGKLHFNEGSNNYFKIHISYLKKNFSLNANRYYNINIPGFLPQFKYTNSMYTNGNTFSAFDLPDEEKKE